MVTYFENLIVRLHVLYILDKYFKLFFKHNFIYKNLKFKQLFDATTIDL